MNNKSKVINIVLPATLCFLLLLTSYCQAVTPEEQQKIEQAAPTKATVIPKQPRKLLVFTLCGKEGFVHPSIPYVTKALEIIGQKTGAFKVTESNDMSVFQPNSLKQFDAVCFNNTTRLDFNDPVLQKSLMDFVKQGKGIVGIHAATDNFYTWPEAAAMLGGSFDGHPWNAPGTWAFKIEDPTHPVTAAFEGKGFKISEEVYRIKPVDLRQNCRVLMSLDMSDPATAGVAGLRTGEMDYPVSWVRSFGRGRVFYTSLGHNLDLFWDARILRHYLDGIQFAMGDLDVDTTPSSLDIQQLDDILKKIAVYDYGKSRECLTELTDFIHNASGHVEVMQQIEKRLSDLLQSDATLASKQFVCKQLAIIGTEASVPALSVLLTRPETSDMARYALERILGPEADKALRDGLDKTSGKVKIGIINSTGQRRDKQAVKQLISLLGGPEQEAAEAAVAALGKIGGKEAAKALKKELKKSSGKNRITVADAYLVCAERFLAEGEAGSAQAIYKQLYAKTEPMQIRTASLRGLVSATPEKAVKIIVDNLKTGEPAMQTAAIGLVSTIPSAKIDDIVAQLANLPADGQVQLLSALADRGDRSALAAVVKSTKSSDEPVRIAASKALMALGDASTVDLLARTAANAEGAEQQAARESLYRLRGTAVDETILANIDTAEPKIKIELIRAVGKRGIKKGLETLLSTARNGNEEVRVESIKNLANIAGPEYEQSLVKLIINAKSDTERKEAENTVVAVSRKSVGENAATAVVLNALASTEDAGVRCSLLRVLGEIGDEKSYSALREAIANENEQVQLTAIRALSNWPDDRPIAELLKVTKTSTNNVHSALALRGFIRLAGLGSDIEGKVQRYKLAMAMAQDLNEKKMILAGLGEVKSIGALKVAKDYAGVEGLQQEAEAAVAKIAEATSKGESEKVESEKQRIYLTGADLSAWRESTGSWQVVGEAVMDPANEKLIATKPGSGVMVNGPEGKTENLISKEEFGDMQAHVEFMIPSGSNSGVYVAGLYEIQILDTFAAKQPNYGDCGGIYQRWDETKEPKGFDGHPPLVNAALPAGQWQSFDIVFRAARFDESGKKIANARVEKVVHNGIVIHQDVELTGPTRGSMYPDERGKGPILLQADHGPVAYRNIWVVRLDG